MSRYITTTLPYVNASPHLGHALEFVEADAYARALRARNEDVFFNIGTDEHGAKVAEKALASGEPVQEFVDENSEKFKSFADRLNISYTSFIRTTNPAHKLAAQVFWQKCLEKGDVYKAAYEVKYCTGCELEKTDSELVDGCCPLHSTQELDIRTEENYYFRFSNYEKALLDHYAQNPYFIVPKERANEIISFVSGGLKDFSISRPSEKLSWGVPVPGDTTQTMYVWFDALVNYISALGWPDDQENFKKFWVEGAPVQIAGKDNLRQQTAMWQAMLMSAGLPLSRQILIHGNITLNGQKMSKSLGNTIDPIAVADKYGVDALRYILLRHANPFEDSDMSDASIAEWYTANLVNGLGNLVARIMKLAEANLPSPVSLTVEDTTVESAFSEKIEAFEFQQATDLVFEHIQKGDEYMTSNEPFKKIKSENSSVREQGLADIEKLVRHIAKVAMHLALMMPDTSAKILAAVSANKKPENLFPRL